MHKLNKQIISVGELLAKSVPIIPDYRRWCKRAEKNLNEYILMQPSALHISTSTLVYNHCLSGALFAPDLM
jgi:hypothetical protein